MPRKYTTKTVNEVEVGDLLVMGARANRIDRIDDSEKSYRTLYVFAGTETWDYKPVRKRRTTVVETIRY